MKEQLKKVLLSACTTETSWFDVDWEQAIYSDSLDKFLGELVVNWQLCLVCVALRYSSFSSWVTWGTTMVISSNGGGVGSF